MPLRKSKRGLVSLLLVTVLLAQDFLWAFPGAFEAGPVPQYRAQLEPSRDFPWVSLKLYRGPDGGRGRERSLRAAPGPVLSMAAGDFDEDGVQDLISAVETASGGTILFHRGNLDAIYPHSAAARASKLAGTFTDQPFFSARNVAAVGFAPELTAAGDFDGDGHFDLAVAQEGAAELHFLSGDGAGSLSPVRTVNLGAPITQLVAEDVNRRDGLKDLIVGLTGQRSQVRVYEGPHGAMSAQPEIFEIDGALSALTVGQLDDDPAIDIAAAAGTELSLIRGRDRKLSISRPSEPVVVDAYRFDFQIRQLVTGDFTGDYRYELAALADGGEVRLISLAENEPAPATRLWRRPARPLSGLAAFSISGGGRQRLVPVRVSTFPKDDLVLFEPGARTMAVLVEDGREQDGETDADPSSLEISYTISDGLRAVLPMRLSPDALDDLVMATSGSDRVVVAQTTPNITYTVNTNLAGNDLTPNDGVCDFDPPNNLCNWNSALRSANGTPGLDMIDFGITEVQAPNSQPLINEPILVDGTSQGRVEFNGTIILNLTGSSVFRGLAIHGDISRLELRDFGDNIVEGNYFGTIDGTTADSNGWVRMDDSPRNQIGGTTAQARNLFAATTGTAIEIADAASTDNVVEGNYVGTDAAGVSVIDGLQNGIFVRNAGNNTIGSLSPGGRNLAAGTFRGVTLRDAASNLVQGNYLGTDVNGLVALGNADGVEVNNANGNTIGGTISAARNVISGNTSDGIFLFGTSSENLIQGNYIGVDVTGTAVLGNEDDGINASGSNTFDNTIGGAVEGAGNVISGSGRHAMFLIVDSTLVQSNLVGTDSLGQQVFGNGQFGIILRGDDNIAGSPEMGNVVVGSQQSGIEVNGSNNAVRGNFIGIDPGRSLVGGNRSGVLVGGTSNRIGGTEPGQGNVVAFNTFQGVSIPGGANGNSVLGNSIFSNGRLGIDVTSGDAPAIPVLTSVADGDIQGSLTAAPSTDFRIEVFSSAECDPSGFGEGETFLGALTATTDGGGLANFTAPFALQGPAVTATSTDPDNNTSEFSNCVQVPEDKVSITAITPDPNLGFPPVNPDLTVSFTQIGVNYTMVSDTSGMVVVQLLADGDENEVLGQAQQAIAVTEQQPDGSTVFGEVIAANVVPAVNFIAVKAFVKPDNVGAFTVGSDAVIYDRGDSVTFTTLSPEPADPLTAKERVTITATIQVRLTSAQQGILELQARNSQGGQLVDAPFQPVTFGLNTVQMQTSFDVPEDSNTITVDALLTSGSDQQTFTDPSAVYGVNRVQLQNLNPMSTMLLQAGREQTFEATVDYNIATQTDQGAILLTVLDSDGNLIDAISGNDQADGLSTGPGQANLSTRIFIPEKTNFLTLLAVLADLAGDGVQLAHDDATYQFTLAGRVLILTSGPEIPLFRARVTAEPIVGDVRETLTGPDGVYRLALSEGSYKLTAEPPEEDLAFRVPEEMVLVVDENTDALPDFELGAVNRQEETRDLGTSLETIGASPDLVKFLQFFEQLQASPYNEEVQQLKGFANGQPPAPQETEEGLYRLFLATRAVKSFLDDATGLLKEFAALAAPYFSLMGGLNALDGKIQATLGAFARNQSTKIVGKVIESSSMETMFKKALSRSSSMIDSMRSHLLNSLSNSLAGGPTPWAPRFKKGFEDMTGVAMMGSKVGSFLKPGAAVTSQLTKIFREMLIAFYADLTDESLEMAVSSAQGFQPANDELRFDQASVNAAVSKSRARSTSLQSGTVQLASDLAGELKFGMDVIAAALIPFLAVPPAAPVVVPIVVVFRRLSRLLGIFGKVVKGKLLIDIGLRVYSRIPGELGNAVRSAFGNGSTTAPLTMDQLTRSAPIPAAGVAAVSRAAFLQAGSNFQAQLDAVIGFVEADQFQELVDQVPDLMEADEEFEAEVRTAVGAVLGVMIPTIDQDPGSQGTFESVLDNTMSSITDRLALYLNILAFVSEATEIDSFGDPAYLARKAELLAALVGVRDSVDVLAAATEDANQAASEAETGIATAVIASAKALSGPVEITSVDTPPQSLQVIALVTNVSDTSISGLEAVMPLLDEELGLSFQTPQRVSLPTLGPGASAPASWFLTFDPPGSPAALPLQVRLEVTPEDAAFIPGSFHILLPVVGVDDSDDDGLPDDYEATFGLGVNQISGGDDEDNDGLSNYSEYLIGTLPDDSDTDDDGATDGEEVAAGSDPEDAESTPDSVAREIGDVTKDGSVNIQDVVFLLRFVSGEGPPPFPLSLGDINGDEKVDINDVTLLLKQTAQEP